MAELVADCPRCGGCHITFDVVHAHKVHVRYRRQYWYKAFSICHNCKRSTIFLLSDSTDTDYEAVHKAGLLNMKGSLNNYVNVERYIGLRDTATVQPPEHIPANLDIALE